jgi:chromosome segregation ATPase
MLLADPLTQHKTPCCSQDASEQREKLAEDLLTEKQTRAEAQNNLKTKELQYTNAQAKVHEAQENIDRLKAIVEKLQAKVDEEENAKSEAMRNLRAATQARELADGQVQQLRNELATANAELRSLRATIEDMDSALSASHETSAALESDVRGSSERVKLMTARVR